LPTTRFVYGEWKLARVNVDYHVEADGHYYSVPHEYLHEQVDVRLSAGTVEIFRDGKRVVSHARSFARGRHTTVAAHMPAAHRAHLEWSPSRIINWAGMIGPQTRALVEAILADRPHPEQGYRSCLGILRLGKRYGNARLEAACARALTAGARSYRHVDSIEDRRRCACTRCAARTRAPGGNRRIAGVRSARRQRPIAGTCAGRRWLAIAATHTARRRARVAAAPDHEAADAT
jgi:transposase